MIARGHLLIEDIPGVGKTTLAHVLANILGLSFQRIQFTSDLLPADIIGVSVYLRDENRFEFHQGPVFSQLVLADEVDCELVEWLDTLCELVDSPCVDDVDCELVDNPCVELVLGDDVLSATVEQLED